jgi:hypothetical protein
LTFPKSGEEGKHLQTRLPRGPQAILRQCWGDRRRKDAN